MRDERLRTEEIASEPGEFFFSLALARDPPSCEIAIAIRRTIEINDVRSLEKKERAREREGRVVGAALSAYINRAPEII